MRIDRPAGFYAFYLPYLIGLGYAACIASPSPSPEHIAFLAGIFAFGCMILRGAACTWNDNIDQDFDRKVARCSQRPIARGAVSTVQGHFFTATLVLLGVPLFVFLPSKCFRHAMPITILFGVYPFMKRITNYPQVFLGFPFAWGILMAAEAMEVDVLGRNFVIPTTSLFLANIAWTAIYDTVYAHQDIKDDVKAGVKSMAVRFPDTTRTLTSMLAIIQVGLLILAGWVAKLSSIYFLGTCGGTAAAMSIMISRVDLENPSSCAWFFHHGFWYVGGSITIGLFAEYATRSRG